MNKNKNVSNPPSIDFSRFGEKTIQPFLPTYDKKDYYINLSKFYPEVECLLSANGVGMFAKGDIQAIKGKAKQGKSFFIVAVVTALLKGSFGALKAKKDSCTVLMIDTEQNKVNVARNVRKIHKLCGWSENEDNPRLKVITLRKQDIESRKNIIEEEIASFQPDLVMLDGVKDICRDFLDNKESSDIADMLMRLSGEYNTAICCVLHENKGRGDSNMRGHLGTELVNKCSEEYQIVKDGNTINITQTESRNAPLKGKLYFNIDDNGLPTEIVSQEVAVAKQLDNRSIGADLFTDQTSYTRKELCKKIMEKGKIKDSTAYKKIREGIDRGELLVDDKNNITLKSIEAF